MVQSEIPASESMLFRSDRERRRSFILHFAVVGILGWSIIVAVSLFWNFSNIDRQVTWLASEKARSNWNKDLAFRRWATRHGGLYVRPNARTPPNPYLKHLPHRDVKTTGGQALTLMNPAYMMRQMTEEFEKMYGVKGSITGQVLLNPINKPDAWELDALKQFDNGVKEVLARADINGTPYLRFMKPMVMRKGCVKCHGHLGFKVGDIRGGVSVSVPMAPYLASGAATKYSVSTTHGVVWLIGLSLIAMFSHVSHKRWVEREQAADALAQAKQEADRANAAKSEFLAHMSHELRTPLNSIIGFSGVMVDRVFGEIGNRKYAEYAEDIHAASKHLLNLIGDILDLSKIEAGHAEMSESEFDVASLLEECRVIVQGMAQGKGIHIETLPSSAPLVLHGSETLVKQVVVNLLSNSIKYTARGGAVEMDALCRSDESIVIRIKDTGVGIAAEDILTVVEPFSKLRPNAFVQSEGTGLGLAISKHLMEMHGGEILIESEVGVGTEISLIFPPERTIAAADGGEE